MLQRSPFPGMDPYLEASWGDVHQRLVLLSCDQLQEQLGEGLFARVEERMVIEYEDQPRRSVGPDIRVVEQRPGGKQHGTAVATLELEPDVSVRASEPTTESFIQVFDRNSGNQVITVIEFVSPTNKLPGENRSKYVQKRRELLAGGVSFVEINLCRTGEFMESSRWALIPREKQAPYAAVVWKAWAEQWDYFAFPLRNPLRPVAIPLRENDAPVVLRLQPIIEQVYRNGAYAKTIDYAQPPVPAFEGEDAEWVREIARAALPRSA